MALKIDLLTAANKNQFGQIWLPWLKETMGLEPQQEDIEAMDDPVAFYGASGGAAFIATLDGAPVGTVAVKRLGEAGFEFCKLVVTDAARGQGAGKALIDACIKFAGHHKGPALWLQSFNKLDVALGMYARMGFEHTEPPEQMDVLDRTEVIMKMNVV